MSVSTDPNPTPEIIKLSIEDDEGVRATYPIIHEQIRVGRSEDNEVCLNQRNVSREHALLVAEPQNKRIAVHDLNSYTGIKLNGKRIFESCYLSLGDYIEIGGYVIALDLDGQEANNSSSQRDLGALRSEVEPLPPENHAKLVVVSNNLAGREYHLNRVEMLIGREQSDNDLVINHRSISRNHAKIVWKNNEFTIIDLSSANGIMIGGAPFSAAHLVKGSIIQMGNVKLRYVAPGEDYTFNPIDVEVTHLDEPNHTKKFVGALIVFLAIFFLSQRIMSSFKEQTTQVPAQEENRESQSDNEGNNKTSKSVLSEEEAKGEASGEASREASGEVGGETDGETDSDAIDKTLVKPENTEDKQNKSEKLDKQSNTENTEVNEASKQEATSSESSPNIDDNPVLQESGDKSDQEPQNDIKE